LNNKDVETLINAFSNVTQTRERGVYFDETYYKCLRSDEHSIYAKKVKESLIALHTCLFLWKYKYECKIYLFFCFKDAKGLILINTSKCVLMATYKEQMHPSICIEATEKLGIHNFCLVWILIIKSNHFHVLNFFKF
jgi:profilin